MRIDSQDRYPQTKQWITGNQSSILSINKLEATRCILYCVLAKYKTIAADRRSFSSITYKPHLNHTKRVGGSARRIRSSSERLSVVLPTHKVQCTA